MTHFIKKHRFTIFFSEILFLIFLSFLLSTNLAGQSSEKTVVKDASEVQKIGESVYYLEDAQGNMEISDILQAKKQAEFIKNNRPIFSTPATSSIYWFRLEIQNLTEENLHLQVGKPFGSWYLDIYLPDSLGNYVQPLLLGSLRDNPNALFSSNFIVNLENAGVEKSQIYYVKASGDFPKTHIFQVGSKDAFIKKLRKHDYIQAGYIGVMLTMILYNLFLLISTRERLYLVYVIFSSISLLVVPFDSGDPLFTHPWFWEYHFAWHNITYLVISIFAFMYLELKQKAPKAFWWILFLTIILCFVIPAIRILNLMETPTLVGFFQPVLLVYFLSLISAGIYVWRKGFKNARFYVLGWFFAISSACIFVFTINGLLPINLFTEHVLYFGFGLETIMFAWALGDKWNTLKKEKEKAQTENITLVENQNELLEDKVKKRTVELRNSYKEIQAQAEELLSQQEEIKVINEALEQKVKARTAILERQRNQLKEYAFANSHKVRGPLARMLGLVYLIQREGTDIPENIKQYLEMLAESSEEMDNIIKSLNRLLESGKFFEEE